MVDVHFDGSDEPIVCEGCGTELPAFLDACPYCSKTDEYESDDDDGGTDAPCPSCGALIYDDSERCAICGAWVSMRVPSQKSGMRSTAMVVVVIILVVSILYLMMAVG